MNSQANASAGVSRLPAPGFSRLKAPTVTSSKIQAPQDQDQVSSHQDIPNQTITQTTQQLQKPTNFSEKSIPTPSQGRFSLQTPKTTTSKLRNESSGPDLNFQNQVSNKGASSAIGRGSNIKMPESAQNQHKGNNMEKVKTDQQNIETPKLQSKKGIPLSTTKIETNQPVQPQKKLESGIGKGLTNLKPVPPSKLTLQQPSQPQQAQGRLKVDQDQDQSPNHQAKPNPEQDSKQPRRAMSTFPSTKFGFKGGSNAALNQSISKPLESQPREEEGIHIPSVMSPGKQGTAEIHKVDNRHHNQYPRGRLSVTRQTKREELSRTQMKRGNEQSRSKSAHRMAAIVNTIENAKLEETIKKLELNLQQLPTQFNRTSRLKEFTPLVSKNKMPEPQSQQQQIQLPLQTIPVLHDVHQHTQNSLKNRLSALRDEKKLAKIQNFDFHAPHPEYSNLQRKFDDVIHGGLHSHSVQLPPPFQEEERNLPLSAFKKPIITRHSLIQQDPFELLGALVDLDPFAPAGDEDAHPPLVIEEEDLLLVEEVKAGEDDNPFQVVEQMSCQQEPQSRIPLLLVNDMPEEGVMGGERQGYEKGKERVSITAQYKMKKKNGLLKKEENADSTHQRLSTASAVPQQSHELPHQILSNTLLQATQQPSSQASGNNVPNRVALSACQRQGPALGAKKAFEHKRRRFTKNINSDGISTDGVNPEDQRKECEHCGRRFNEELFEKHFIICEKVFIKRRKPFNSLQQRVQNEEHLKALEIAQSKFSYYNENQTLNPKWKLQRAQFLTALKQARNGRQIEQPEQDDRVQCPHCLKKFAPTTADRHIPLCENKTKDLKFKQAKASMSKTVNSGFGIRGKGAASLKL